MKTKISTALCGLISGLLILGATSFNARAATIDWGSGWVTATSSGTYFLDGTTITLTSSPTPVPSLDTGPFLILEAAAGIAQMHTITFSQLVDFSLTLGGVNGVNEIVTNFSQTPASMILDPGHVWDGTTLSNNGGGTENPSTLSWSGITSLSFEHQYPGPTNANLNLHDSSFTVVPEPSSTALFGLGGLALMLRRRR